MNKGGQSTLFILGIAGMGLSIAMFFDSMKPVKANTLPVEATPVEQIVPTEPVLDVAPAVNLDVPTAQEEEEPTNKADPVNEALPDTTPSDTSTVDTGPVAVSAPLQPIAEEEGSIKSGSNSETSPSQIDYREYYKLRKQEDDIKRSMEAGDNSYNGDGSSWSKRMYFIKEAYRRSREATPIEPVILNRVKYTKSGKEKHKQKK